jgi:ABC-type uncharacterized transport system permease subunit
MKTVSYEKLIKTGKILLYLFLCYIALMGNDRFFINYGFGPKPHFLKSNSELIESLKFLIVLLQCYFMYYGFEHWIYPKEEQGGYDGNGTERIN